MSHIQVGGTHRRKVVECRKPGLPREQKDQFGMKCRVTRDKAGEAGQDQIIKGRVHPVKELLSPFMSPEEPLKQGNSVVRCHYVLAKSL